MLSILLLLCILPPTEQTGVVSESVDQIHLNHVYDESAKPILDQWIFHDATDAGWQIRAWRLDKGAQIQRHPSGDYMLLWHDGDVLREVRAKLFKETWTQHDPEMRERSIYPADERRELMKTRRCEPHDLDLIFP